MTDQNRKRIVQAMKKMQCPHYDIADTKGGKLCMYKAARHYEIPLFMPITQFTTNDGRIIEGDKLKDALNSVADEMAHRACAKRAKDNYAEHVKTHVKDENLHRELEFAENVRKGHVDGLTIKQRLNIYLTALS